MALTTEEGKKAIEAKAARLEAVDRLLKELGTPEDQTRYVSLQMLECLVLFDRKQRAYSSENIAVYGDAGIVIRMFDKLYRLKTLYQRLRMGDDVAADESIEDTLRDICNYAAMALTCRAGQWEGFDPQHQ